MAAGVGLTIAATACRSESRPAADETSANEARSGDAGSAPAGSGAGAASSRGSRAAGTVVPFTWEDPEPETAQAAAEQVVAAAWNGDKQLPLLPRTLGLQMRMSSLVDRTSHRDHDPAAGR